MGSSLLLVCWVVLLVPLSLSTAETAFLCTFLLMSDDAKQCLRRLNRFELTDSTRLILSISNESKLSPCFLSDTSYGTKTLKDH
jgi:hypothetical protein